MPATTARPTTYDALDRLTRDTDPLGRSASYAYDAVGNLSEPHRRQWGDHAVHLRRGRPPDLAAAYADGASRQLHLQRARTTWPATWTPASRSPTPTQRHPWSTRRRGNSAVEQSGRAQRGELRLRGVGRRGGRAGEQNGERADAAERREQEQQGSITLPRTPDLEAPRPSRRPSPSPMTSTLALTSTLTSPPPAPSTTTPYREVGRAPARPTPTYAAQSTPPPRGPSPTVPTS